MNGVMADSLQTQIDRLDVLIAKRENGQALEEWQDGGDRGRVTSLEVLYKRRDKLQAQLNRANRGGMHQTVDPLRFPGGY
jgi:hypothetical protein